MEQIVEYAYLSVRLNAGVVCLSVLTVSLYIVHLFNGRIFSSLFKRRYTASNHHVQYPQSLSVRANSSRRPRHASPSGHEFVNGLGPINPVVLIREVWLRVFVIAELLPNWTLVYSRTLEASRQACIYCGRNIAYTLYS